MNAASIEFITKAEILYGKEAVLDRAMIQDVVDKNPGLGYPYWLVSTSQYREERGKYKLPTIDAEQNPVQNDLADDENDSDENNVIEGPILPPYEPIKMEEISLTQLRMPKLIEENPPTVPGKYKNFVSVPIYKDLKAIISSREFFPVFITGWSGCGKTISVEQAHAELNLPLVRFNVSVETDQTDLLGGPTLINGNVVYRDGPIIIAMKRGCTVLLDEVDRGSDKLMCIQGILEGNSYYNKHTGETIHPKKGFNVFATANTKGKGSTDGRYLSRILDDAFLERFLITIEQGFPTKKTETKILQKSLQDYKVEDDEFVDCLINWADTIRKTYDNGQGSIDEVISTRRLVHICKTYAIFNDKLKSITLCLNRFDDAVKEPFLELYRMSDENIQKEKAKKIEEEEKKKETFKDPNNMYTIPVNPSVNVDNSLNIFSNITTNAPQPYPPPIADYIQEPQKLYDALGGKDSHE